MMMITVILVIFISSFCNGQRVAPGVPPQQYQPHQQQHHQQPQYQQHQQVPVQGQPQGQQYGYQQPHQHQQPVHQQPVPHHQQQQQQQQQPQQQHHPHAHGGHGQPQQVLNAANIQHERQHIAEHLDVPIDTSKMSEQELQFHYFKMHDSDNNNKLDGCELIKSLIHWHADEGKKDGHAHIEKNDGTNNQEQQNSDPKIYSDEKLEEIVDYVLNLMDKNSDGYIEYQEYKMSDEREKNNPNT